MKPQAHPDMNKGLQAPAFRNQDLLGVLCDTADYPTAIVCNKLSFEHFDRDKSLGVYIAMHGSSYGPYKQTHTN